MERERTVSEVVGRNVASLRKAAGLTQQEVAEAMADIGFATWHRQTVGEVEAGAREVRVDELVALAAFFDLLPEALLVSPGSDLPYSTVRIGDRTLPVGQWVALWYPKRRSQDAPPEGTIRKAIDAMTRTLTRPWSRIWRRHGGGAGAAFAQAREEILGRRTAYPGPIFVRDIDADGPVTRSTSLPPWGASFVLTLNPGEPYVARDEVEREHLEALERGGFIRRIDKQTAWRMRRERGS